MNHLLISREYPPSPYAAGGIGAYVDLVSRLLAEHGETVHVIAQQWPGAPRRREERLSGRLIVHRVPLDEPLDPKAAGAASHRVALDRLRGSVLASQAFMWQAAVLAESLVATEGIDVIEAQDYEAPAYFLLVRRALGLGAARTVPVIVHLHTPTEFTFRENGWDERRPDFAPLQRLETWAIQASDAILSPSRFLARIAAARYGLDPVEVIAYPVELAPPVERTDDVWRTGTILYTGRMEPRKGVLEWIDGATAVAVSDPSACLVLIGSDTSLSGRGDGSMRERLRERIPASLDSRVSFLDAVPRPDLAAHRAQARIAVVPSRWENFPYSCIEAMASGLPVLVTPTGGMAEMIEDGRTGWIAAGCDPVSLEAALRRALATPPARLAAMGAAAAQTIRATCDNRTVIQRQLDFRRAVVARGVRIAGTAPVLDTLSPEPQASGCSDEHLAVLRHAELTTPEAAGATPPDLGEQPWTLFDILRASPRDQLAVVSRAVKNPAYVGRWLAWHARRLFGSSSS